MWKEFDSSIKMEGFLDYGALASIIKMINGNFRLTQRLFKQIKPALAINQFTLITTEVVEKAHDSLVIGIK
jgi:hypothetical protein